MRTQAWAILSVMAAAALPWACFRAGTNVTSGTGGNDAGVRHDAGTGGSSTSTSSSTGTGGVAACTQILTSTPCNTCIAAHCCAQINGCNADTECIECFLGQEADAGLCGVGATATTLAALTNCAVQSCSPMCANTGPTCNPVTNAGCEAGAACNADTDSNGNPTYDCYAPPPSNVVPVCGQCTVDAGCLPGSTCFQVDNAGQCARFCCNDGDCGDGGACDSTQGLFGIGLCVVASTLDSGPEQPSCDTPVVAPSQGQCLMGPDGG